MGGNNGQEVGQIEIWGLLGADKNNKPKLQQGISRRASIDGRHRKRTTLLAITLIPD